MEQDAPTLNAQQQFIACSGHTAAAFVPPAGWSFLGNPLLGTMPLNPAVANLLNNLNSPAGVCLQICSSSQTQMQVTLGSPGGNLSSQTSYPVSQNASSVLTADLNNDGLPDLIVLNSDTQATLSVYVMQANGTLGTPATVPYPPAAFSRRPR